MNWFKSSHAKWTYLGIVFGCLFPVAGTLLEVQLLKMPFSWSSFILAQSGQKILWIVDLAPIVLGIVFNLVGKREQELQRINVDLNKTNQELIGLQTHLEQRVAERTTELEQANQKHQRRADQFEAVTQVSRYISSIQNLDNLLHKITSVINQHFDFYHIGIFLIDANKDYAVLKATNSEGGQKMLARNHRLQVGSEGIVGFVTSLGKARISLDVGSDSVYFDNPDLPETRSEIALPLIFGDLVIGALDIQSIEPNAFSDDDVVVFNVLADQLAIAIQNARSLEQARAAAAKAESTSRQLIGQAWTAIKRFTPVIGYYFDGTEAKPLTQYLNGDQVEGQQEAFSVPVQLRGESIGKLRIKAPDDGHQWTDDEIAIIRATAERVALAAENARLVAESQKNAAKERVISEISSKIGASINLDNILQSTLREMGRILPGAEISIQVENK